jgi:TrpR family trp operon transcriptional repressor
MVDLETTMAAAQSRDQVVAFLAAVLTPKELRQCRTRWHACQMSAAGATQREIRAELGVGLATATRAAKAARENRRIISSLVSKTVRNGR